MGPARQAKIKMIVQAFNCAVLTHAAIEGFVLEHFIYSLECDKSCLTVPQTG